MMIVTSEKDPPLVHHLVCFQILEKGLSLTFQNDHVFLSHHYSSEYDSESREADSLSVQSGRASVQSDRQRQPPAVSLSSEVGARTQPISMFASFLSALKDVAQLTVASQKVSMTAEIAAYLQNIVTFLRMHRAVAGGASPRATHHFRSLTKSVIAKISILDP